ncbi:MAG: site-specific DNA-methyltransferase [Lactobacillus iners]|nr:site-specific DNA-methyltransferase [Lactobacillus iners]
MMQDNIPVFTEVKEREIKAKDENSYNFLLEGDNLHSLKLLEKTHAGKIDVIYIDPPYNTGNKDFIYDDSFVDKTDGYSHSKWLSFMSERLEIAKLLLSEEGVIFISIDDHEQAQLKLLCDSVFGADNFIAESIDASNSSKNNSNYIAVNHEYLLCYAKNISGVKKGWLVKKNQIDEFERRAKTLLKMNLSPEKIHNELLQLVKYPCFYDFDHYTYVDQHGVYGTFEPGGVKNGNFDTEILHPITGKPCVKPSGGWRYSEATLQELVKKDGINFGKDETVIPRIKRYLHDYPMQVPKSTLFFDSQATTKWLKRENIAFDFPKSIDYIKHILSYTQDNSATVFDFFVGFRVIIMTQANSQVNIRVLELLPKFKIKKMNRWCAV